VTAAEFPLGPEVLEPARRALGRGLCGECFGRLFGRAGHGLTNPERAARIAEALGPLPPADACPICEGAFDRIPVWVERCEAAGADYEWARFSCGSRWDPETLAREEALWLAVGTACGESLHSAFNRELGKRLHPGHPAGLCLPRRRDGRRGMQRGRHRVRRLSVQHVGEQRHHHREQQQHHHQRRHQ